MFVENLKGEKCKLIGKMQILYEVKIAGPFPYERLVICLTKNTQNNSYLKNASMSGLRQKNLSFSKHSNLTKKKKKKS